MIDSAELGKSIEKHISLSIEKHISENFNDESYRLQVNNIIQRSVEKSVKEILVNQKSDFQNLIANNIKTNPEITSSILEQIIPHLDKNFDQQFRDSVKDYIITEISGQEWKNKIQASINQIVSKISSEMISSLEIGDIVEETIKKSIRLNDEKIKSIFSGIQDNSKGSTEFVVMPDYVVVENELVSNKIKNINNIETKTLSVEDISVTGSINVDNSSWQSLADTISKKTFEQVSEKFISDAVDQVLKTSKHSGIEFSDIRVGNQPLVDGQKLSDYIKETKIEKTGTLKTLDVSGNANICDSLHVVNGRIGVNTGTPDMSLNIWDEEVSISAGKISTNRAFIGSTRKHELALGVNRQGDIVIDSDGTTTIKSLRVDKNSIGHADQVPGWSGTKGDFIINKSPGNDGVFGWICLGDYRWKTLKSA